MNPNPLELYVDDDLTLREFTLDDAEPLFALIDKNRDHLSQYGDVTARKYPTLHSIETSIGASQLPPKLRLGIWTDTAALVGTVNLTTREQHTGEVGYWLGEEFQGNGYTTRSVRRLVSYAFTDTVFTELTAKIHVDNSPSKSVLDRCGFSLDYDTGDSTLVYSLAKSDFLQG